MPRSCLREQVRQQVAGLFQLLLLSARLVCIGAHRQAGLTPAECQKRGVNTGWGRERLQLTYSVMWPLAISGCGITTDFLKIFFALLCILWLFPWWTCSTCRIGKRETFHLLKEKFLKVSTTAAPGRRLPQAQILGSYCIAQPPGAPWKCLRLARGP